MLYTRTGDGGESGLYGTKERFPKHHPVYEALGSVDELNSLIGLIRAYAHERRDDDTSDQLYRVQEMLFVVQAELAGADKRITQTEVEALESAIGTIEASIEKPRSFLVPGATVASALFDYARTVSRRAERSVLRAQGEREIDAALRAYLNRLSSFFYALARHAAQTEAVTEKAPAYNLPR